MLLGELGTAAGSMISPSFDRTRKAVHNHHNGNATTCLHRLQDPFGSAGFKGTCGAAMTHQSSNFQVHGSQVIAIIAINCFFYRLDRGCLRLF